jgi:hypothetical protein
MSDQWPLVRNRPDDLVTGDERVLAGLPIVVDQMEVAVTDPAVRDLDFHIVRAERIGLEVVWASDAPASRAA